MKFRTQVSTIVLAVVFLLPVSVFAQTVVVDYENLLSDEQLTTYQSMSQSQIQRFLESKQGYLGNYFVLLPDTGERVAASELIFRAAQNHHINPQFLLTLLQKEQSLVEEKTPKLTQLDWATGYGCFDNQPCNERWRGFHKQINSAAEQFRYYFEHITEYFFQPGKATTIDGQVITPKNIATAALYNYTPHLHGNSLFKTLWDTYFMSLLPDGTIVQVPGDPGVWLIQDGVRRAFTSELALVSRYDPELIVPIAQADLDGLPRGIDIEFAAYSLLEGDQTGNIYLLTRDTKRLISSPDVFRTLGFNPEEVEVVSDGQLARIEDARPITISDAYPVGTLLKDKVTNEVYYVESGRKYAVVDLAIMLVNYPDQKPVVVDSAALRKYASGFPVVFRDGTLVKGANSEVYVISNGRKRHITSEDAFNAIGYKWKNIVATSDKALSLHPLGDPIVIN